MSFLKENNSKQVFPGALPLPTQSHKISEDSSTFEESCGFLPQRKKTLNLPDSVIKSDLRIINLCNMSGNAQAGRMIIKVW